MADSLVLTFDMDISSAEAKMKRLEREFEAERKKLQEVNAERAEEARKLDELIRREKELKALETDRKAFARYKREHPEDVAGIREMNERATQRYGDDWTRSKSSIDAERASTLKQIEETETNIANLEKQKEQSTNRTAQKYEQLLGTQQRVRGEQEKANEAQRAMPASISRATTAMGKFTHRIAGLVKRVFIFSLITRALRALRKAIGEIIGQDSELSKYVSQIKGNLSVMGRTVFETLKPAITWLLRMLSKLTYLMAVILAKVLHKDVQEMAKMAKNSKKTAKNAERTAFAFDTIQKVDKKDDKNDNGATFEQFDVAGWTEEQLGKIMAIAGVALIAIGLILCFFGHIGLGVGMIVAGALIEYEACKMSDELEGDLKTFVTKTMLIAGGAFLVIGIILCLFQQYHIGIPAIIAGLAMIGTSVALNWDTLKEKVSTFFEEHQALIGGFKIVIGVLLCLTGIGAILGVTLIKDGAHQMAEADPAKYGWMEDTIVPIMDRVKKVLTGTFLVVIGVLLCATGVGIPLGLSLIKKGIANVYEGVTGKDSDVFMKWLDEKLGAVKDAIFNFFNGLPDGVKIFVNGIIKGLNWLIEKANKLIQGLNSISFGDWSPNLPYINYLPYLEVPKLAKGAVIAGGSPFLAMLGDQRKGQTNIEAPLETIMEAVRNVMGEQNINISFEGSMAQLARVLNPQIKKEQKRASIW